MFVITVGQLKISAFPPNGLFYFTSLPWSYWVGVSASLVLILRAFTKETQHRSGLLPLLVLASFLYLLPQLSYENPRYQDVYTHGAGVQHIINFGHIDPTYSYSQEYPSAFLFMAISHILGNWDQFAFFKFFNAFTLIFSVVLIYCIARTFSTKYSLLAPLAFMALMWVDEGHFSPQGFTILFYLMTVWSLVNIFVKKETKGKWLLMLILSLLLVNISNPTNSFFMFITTTAMGLLSFLIRSSHLSRRRFLSLLIFNSVLWVGWTAYTGSEWSLAKIERFGGEVTEGSEIKVTPAPDITYSVVNLIRYADTGFMIVASLLFTLLMMKSPLKPELKIITIGLLSNMLLLPVTSLANTVVLARNYMLLILPWCILLTIFLVYSEKRKILRIGRVAVMVALVSFVIMVPVSKYGSEPTTYVPNSTVYAAQLIAGHSSNILKTEVSYSSSAFAVKYFDAVDGKTINNYRWSPKYYELNVANANNTRIIQHVFDMSAAPNDIVMFSEAERNILIMRYSDLDTYNVMEDTVASQYNMIVNSGTTRVYARP